MNPVRILVPLSLLLLSGHALADMPIGPYPECGFDGPCPGDFQPLDEWDLYSAHPDEVPETEIRANERAFGSGMSVDKAWSISVGRPDVVIAIMDSGIEWSRGETINKHWLNRGELPFPQDASGQDIGAYDLNGDGVFNMADWADDPRVDPEAGENPGGNADWMRDPSDLIALFSDGVDDDGNGYVDDISGWDFFWNDNNPFDEVEQGGYSHGSGQARLAAAEANGGGGHIGACPNCMVLNLRMGDGFVADVNAYGAGAAYATDLKIQKDEVAAMALEVALGTLNNSQLAIDATEYAWDNGVPVLGSAADETAWHANLPSANHHVVYVHAIRYNGSTPGSSDTWFAFSNCTNYGARLMLSASSDTCSSGAVARTAGIAGLVLSAGLDAVEAGTLDSMLTASEVYQLMTLSVDDVAFNPADDVEELYPSREGWDRFFGYGRLNAWKALERIQRGDLYPDADILDPGWFYVFNLEDGTALQVRGVADAPRGGSFTWELQGAPSWDPAEGDFEVLASGSSDERIDGLLGTVDLASMGVNAGGVIEAYDRHDTNVTKGDKVHIHMATLRLQVTDAAGNTAEMRKTINLQRDPDLRSGFPKRIGASGEVSPVLVDVTGDGIDEVVTVSSDGVVMVADGNYEPLPGWPQRFASIDELDADSPRNHLSAPAFASGDVSSDQRHATMSTPAIGDLDGDGVPEIVAASLEGFLGVWKVDGTMMAGWPYRLDRTLVEGVNQENVNNYDLGFFSSPALGDLDGDGDLEIVAPAMDSRVYVFHHDGTSLDGFPLELRSDFQTATGTESRGERIISSPALGDVDGDGRTDIVLGTNQKTTGTYGLAYAIAPDGTFLPGWPAALSGFYTNALPYVGEGVPGSPALCDLDGDGTLEVAVHTIADAGRILGSDGEQWAKLAGVGSEFGEETNAAEENASLIMINSGTFADITGDGTKDYFVGAMGFGYAAGLASDGTRTDHDHLLGGWSGDRTGEPGSEKMPYLNYWPRIMEDMQFFVNPAVVDLDNDGLPEVLNGSAGSVVHAFDVQGNEPLGWPKDAGNWMMASPAIGDTDGDGKLEVWVTTRGGQLFAWNTEAIAATADRQWINFHHDARNTGNCHTELPIYEPLPEEPSCGGCATREAAPGALLLLAPLGLLGWRRRDLRRRER